MTTTVLATRNTDWGFWGPIGRTDLDPTEAWTLASEAISAATGAGPEGVRDFLDSRYGRHFADDVVNGVLRGDALKQATEAATKLWMGWSVGRFVSRETGIPAHLPYLTGLATHFAIQADAGD